MALLCIVAFVIVLCLIAENKKLRAEIERQASRIRELSLAFAPQPMNAHTHWFTAVTICIRRSREFGRPIYESELKTELSIVTGNLSDFDMVTILEQTRGLWVPDPEPEPATVADESGPSAPPDAPSPAQNAEPADAPTAGDAQDDGKGESGKKPPEPDAKGDGGAGNSGTKPTTAPRKKEEWKPSDLQITLIHDFVLGHCGDMYNPALVAAAFSISKKRVNTIVRQRLVDRGAIDKDGNVLKKGNTKPNSSSGSGKGGA